MRVTPTDLAIIADAVRPFDTDTIRQAYRDGRFPRADKVKDLDTRYRWDLFHASKVSRDLPRDTYTDAHLDTALRHVVAPL